MWLVAALLVASALAQDLQPSCEKPVYCDSELLHHVQLAQLYNDSKTFVDMRLQHDPNTTLNDFNELLVQTNNKPTKAQIQQFVDEYFATGDELEDWTPPDFNSDPSFIKTIRDEALRTYAKDIVGIWPALGRKIKQEVHQNPDQFSMIPVTHGFVIPGGRFKELYYWDTYWIIEGLLISEMKDTVRGVIENLIELLRKIGLIPNGSRWYYQERSQPPLLTAMVSLYMRETKNMTFLRENIDAIEEELTFWLDTQVVSLEKDGKEYSLLRYFAPSAGPRPESYLEDYESAKAFDSDERKTEFYVDLKSAAESGWDFSTRWFINTNRTNSGNLTNVHTRYIIPVDLNSIFANALQTVAHFQALLGNPRKGAHWAFLAKQWRNNIDQVLWNEKSGVWLDYDILNNVHRDYFYPSNVAPLWMGAVEKRLVARRGKKVISYLRASGALDYPGGIPTSLINSGEQWDYPNAWPPLVSILVNALEAVGTTEAKDMAFSVAQKWIRACHKGFADSGQMFEKYDVREPGEVGGGGEYVVQNGFGWSNGVVLEFLAKYGRRLTSNEEAVVGLSK